MQLHAERSSAQLAATDIGVVFQQQQGTTRLMVEDGETAVIGGLTVTEVSATTRGNPDPDGSPGHRRPLPDERTGSRSATC
jgi:type IV pilus assembly protein PilQ